MSRLTLLWSPRSPYARKALMALDLLGLLPQVDLRLTRVALQMPPDPALLAENPLGKIPVLVVPGLGPLFDSRLIVSWLDRQTPGVLFPADPAAHLETERLETLADGVTDVLLLWRTEESRGDRKNPQIAAGFETKVRTGMPVLEAIAPTLDPSSLNVGQIALRCCLDQLDFRYAACNWRAAFPALAAWHAAVGAHRVIAAHPIPTDLPDHNTGVAVMPLSFTETN